MLAAKRRSSPPGWGSRIPSARTPKTSRLYLFAALLLWFLLAGCGTTGIGPLPPGAEPPSSEAVRLISGQVANPSQLEGGEQRLWVIAHGGDAQGWYYPDFPLGTLATNGALDIELPAELGPADLIRFSSFCRSGVRLSDPEAAGIFTPFLMSDADQIIAQTTSPTSLSRPANGDIAVFRIYADRDVRLEGNCRGGLLQGGRIDLDLRMGWNLLTIEITGLPFHPTVRAWSGILPENVAWYALGP